MEERKLKRNKLLFLLLVAISFGAVYIYNVLTPVMSDDLLFDRGLYQTFADLFIQEYERYMTWNGRSVLQIIMTIFSLVPKGIFDFCNSLCFMLFGLLIYWNIRGRKKYDYMLFLMIQLFVWNFCVDFSQTVLWLSGACNYLWGITIILGFITVYRYLLEKWDLLPYKAAIAAAMFPFGILAGWGNENTSGGAGLLLLLFTIIYVQKNKKFQSFMITGMGGMAIGFGFLILAPGNGVRGAIVKAGETYSGMAAYVSRGLKVIKTIDQHFMVYIAVIIILGTYFYYTKHKKEEFIEASVFVLAAMATALVLIFTPEPMARAYFGANVYMMIGVVQMIVKIRENDVLLNSLRVGITLSATVWMCFVYVEEGANLARILREVKEREVFIEEQVAEGKKDILLPKLRPQFQSRFSYMYDSDISTDESYWINDVYCIAYDLDSITAIERDEWDMQEEQRD